jgi:hypothetical protein
MEATHTLTPHLKHLRLSGILETLEVRHRQAIEEKWSYVEFLERLLQDEVERRGQKQLTLRLRRAAFQPDKTLERFDFSFNPTLNRQQILDLATCQFIVRKEPVLICGPTGVGKPAPAGQAGEPPGSSSGSRRLSAGVRRGLHQRRQDAATPERRSGGRQLRASLANICASGPADPG